MSQINIVKSKIGKLELNDESILFTRVAIINITNIGSSPFGGVQLNAQTAGGSSLVFCPDSLKKEVENYPILSANEIQAGEWEFVGIKEEEHSFEDAEIEINDKIYSVHVEAIPTMVARNKKYKTKDGLPLYSSTFTNIVKWSVVNK
ncbi:MAG: hypothetical protein JRN10_08425 [Nitrososphaerota archaeon]|jgi:hypothetical protein|nr:hypothetical protein [Nitrososphaerota archaeon]MDG6931243.1 hypothetical protein [Nitrososphaerota archaeon]